MSFENSTELEQVAIEMEPPERAGVIVTVLEGKPHHRAVVVPKGELTVGRSESATLPVDDAKMSRQHFGVVWNPTTRRWTLYDKGSANGTVVDGTRVEGSLEVGETAVVRAGRSLFLLTPDAASKLTPPKVVQGLLASAPLIAALEKIKLAGAKGLPLLIIGRSGTGKEHAAEIYQQASSHRNGPFIIINCAQIERSLADARLFGARRGSFSGAERDTPGAIAEAHRGVLFLDEVAELDLVVQAKLLRFCQSGEIQVVGEPMPRKVDVHIVSATHKDLDAMVAAGTFRHDLLARLAPVRVDLPSLADRIDEIPLLADLLLPDPKPRNIRFYEALMRADWSELNIRGLGNALTTSLVNAINADELVPEHIPGNVKRFVSAPSIAPAPPASVSAPPPPPEPAKAAAPTLLSPTDMRRAKVVAEYRANGGDIEATAKAVDLSVRRVYAILTEAGVRFRRPS
jgi:DNA-binding NtrC family response regulator